MYVDSGRFIRYHGMRKHPFDYLNIETGDVIVAEHVPVGDGVYRHVYDVDVGESRYIRIPCSEMFLRQSYLASQGFQDKDMEEYGIRTDLRIEKFLLFAEEDDKLYREYVEGCHFLFEDHRIEVAYQRYAREQDILLSTEWLNTLIQPANRINSKGNTKLQQHLQDHRGCSYAKRNSTNREVGNRRSPFSYHKDIKVQTGPR